jgi:hypothetical protein
MGAGAAARLHLMDFGPDRNNGTNAQLLQAAEAHQ